MKHNLFLHDYWKFHILQMYLRSVTNLFNKYKNVYTVYQTLC